MNSQSVHWVPPEISFYIIKKSLDQWVVYYIQLFEDFLENNDPLLSLHNHDIKNSLSWKHHQAGSRCSNELHQIKSTLALEGVSSLCSWILYYVAFCFSHCAGFIVLIVNAWIVFSSSTKQSFTSPFCAGLTVVFLQICQKQSLLRIFLHSHLSGQPLPVFKWKTLQS